MAIRAAIVSRNSNATSTTRMTGAAVPTVKPHGYIAAGKARRGASSENEDGQNGNGGPPTSRPLQEAGGPCPAMGSDGPAQSNGTARLQDDEIVIRRGAGEQFETSFNLSAQH